ncbi:hypothetical protein [Salinibacterium sp. ZJ450]|uniref:hypothetical protein n=1 Tax=Salinibacterium sp. ZJ450 TaxID=2708338 RepID=UPI00141DBFC5|nr:hypothetical protein [Salinibacterium sp. ZJ450]
MGFLDRLFGREENDARRDERIATTPPAPRRSDDEIAVERYQYLLRTAPPETIEQVHEEAFSKLTDEQRQLLFQQLTATAPAGEQPRGDDPRSLAQSATRSELRQPGTMQRSMQGPSFGSMVGSSLLGTVAGYVIGSALVSSFMPSDGGGEASADDAGTDDASGADPGGDVSDAGGDTGGGDSGGGDFGGGDFGGGGFDFGGDF